MGGVVVCFALFLAAMAVCLVMGWSFLWALLLGLALFTLHGRKQGHSLQTMWGMAWSEGRKVLIVLRIFVFIGAITALWRSGGTIVFFIYYGVQAISPKLFVLVAFLLTALIAYALGTSFGVIGGDRADGSGPLRRRQRGGGGRRDPVRRVFRRPVLSRVLLCRAGGGGDGDEAL